MHSLMKTSSLHTCLRDAKKGGLDFHLVRCWPPSLLPLQKFYTCEKFHLHLEKLQCRTTQCRHQERKHESLIYSANTWQQRRRPQQSPPSVHICVACRCSAEPPPQQRWLRRRWVRPAAGPPLGHLTRNSESAGVHLCFAGAAGETFCLIEIACARVA